MTADLEAVTRTPEARKLLRNIESLIGSPIRNRCVSCGHVKHNELGYCQTGQCGCETGTTIEGVGIILRRDLAAVLVSLPDDRLAEAEAKAWDACAEWCYYDGLFDMTTLTERVESANPYRAALSGGDAP